MNIPVSYIETKNTLRGEYLEVFEQIESYCTTKLMTEQELDDRMTYLLDIFAEAQANNVPVRSVTGDDIKQFCGDFLSDCSWRSLFGYIAQVLKRISWVTVFLLGITVVCELISGNINAADVLMNNSKAASWLAVGVTAGVLMQLAAGLIIRSFIFKAKKYRSIYSKMVNGTIWTAGIAAVIVFSFSELTLPVSDAAVLVLSVLYLAGYYVVRGILNQKNGHRFFYDGSQKQRTTFGQQVVTSMVGEFRRDYDKKNERLARKGKPLMSQEDYLAKTVKDTKAAKISTIVSFGLIAAGYISSIISVAADSAPADTLFYAATMVIVLVILYFVIFYPLVVYPYLIRKKFFGILEKSGKNLFDKDAYDCIAKYYEDAE